MSLHSLTVCLFQEDEDTAARCETVLNTTMAEMDTYHTQKVEDFQELAKEHLDGEIALYEQVSRPFVDQLRKYPSLPTVATLLSPRATSVPNLRHSSFGCCTHPTIG